MAIYANNCGRDEESVCGLWTEAARLRRKITSQISKHRLIYLLVVFYISSLCARMPSADACQRERLPDYCFWEYVDEYLECPLTHTEKVGCTYAKINSSEGLLSSEGSENFPSQPRGFAIKSFTSHFQGVRGCGHIFNFTWKLPQDASFKYLKGFLLDIMFDNMGEQQRFLRHFQVQTKELTAMDLSQIVFHYDCFVPRPNTFFQIRLHSLPIAPLDMSNEVLQRLQTYGNEVNVDLNNTGNWKASIWVKSSETSSSSSLEICFTTAPEDFRFTRYNVYLLSSSSNSHPLRLIRYSATVEVDQTGNAADACHTFDVCCDTYRIEIEPESDDGPDCNCKLESKCVATCETSVFERVDMTQSASRCPPTVLPCTNSTAPKTSSDLETATPSQFEPGKITGFVVGTFLGLVVFGLLGFLVWKRKRHRQPTTPDPKRVFILDSSDTRDFQPCIRFLADFLRRRSHCQVHVLSDWLQTETDSDLSQIWNRIVNADCTIFVMSEACRQQYRDVIRGVIRPPSGRNSIINNAVVAMILLCNNDCEAVRRKCFEVCLPGNCKCYELRKAVQRSYSFPGEIADLVLEVRGVKQPRFYPMIIGKSLERRKAKQEWKKKGVVWNEQTTRGLGEVEETTVLQECLVQKPGQDGGEYLSLNNNRGSFDDLNQNLETESQTQPLKNEVCKCDSGFSGSVVLEIAEMMSFHPPLSRDQSSSNLSSSVGYGGDSLLFSSSYDFSSTSTDEDDDEGDSVA